MASIEKLSVLIVEDSEDDALLMLHELETAGYEIFSQRVENESDLIDALRNERWDVVLSDYTMPKLNGFEVLRIVRERDKEIPFIFVSATIGEDRAVATMKAGANDYVMKWNLKRLLPSVEREIRESIEKKEKDRVKLDLEESRERFYSAFQFSGIGICLIDKKLKFLDVNPTFCHILDFEKSKMKNIILSELIYHEDIALLHDTLGKISSGKTDSAKLNIRFHKSSGVLIFTSTVVSVVKNSFGEIIYFVFQSRDVTSEKFNEERLKYMITHDMQTGMYNRNFMERYLEEEIEKNSDENTENTIGLIYIGIDRFFLKNDIENYEIQSPIISEIAERLRSFLGMDRIIARMHDDEFAILISGVDREGLKLIIKEIIGIIKSPLFFNKMSFVIRLRVGVSLYPTDAKSPTFLVKYAHLAMLHNRSSGEDFDFFNQDILVKSEERARMELSIRRALHEDLFEIFYQPIFSVKENKICKLEALVRWRHAEDVYFQPKEFIYLAEETGLIVQIGEIVFYKAIRGFKEILSSGLIDEKTSLSINISPQQVHQNQFLEQLQKGIEELEINPENLNLELTENTFFQDIKRSLEMLKKLREMKINITVDDFGIGYSSLSYLKELPVNSLKIDSSFIKNIPQDSGSKSIVLAIISLGHILGYSVVAEGIETWEQYEFLVNHQVDEIQGFYICKPQPLAGIKEFLSKPLNLPAS